MADFNEILKQTRKRSGLTQQQVAAQLFVSRKTVSSWETGRNLPDINMVAQLAALFAVSTDELLLGRNPAPQVTNQTNLLDAALLILLAGRLAISATAAMLLFSDVVIVAVLLLLILLHKHKLTPIFATSSLFALSVGVFYAAWQNLFEMDFSLQTLYVIGGTLLLLQPLQYYWKTVGVTQKE